MAYTSLSFKYYSPAQAYAQFDIVGGLTPTDNTFYYSTIPANLNNNPAALFIYNITGYSRSQDIVTLYYTHTGSGPSFTVGSMMASSVGSDTSANYSGMILNGGLNGIQGILKYLNPGWDQNPTSSAGTITTLVSPAWTTGLMSIPSYSTSYENQQTIISAQFEPGYEQRQASSINPNTDIWALTFLDRSSKETRMIRHFTQNMAGVYSFPIMITDPNFDNQPNQKFVTTAGVKFQTKAFNINDISIQVKRVFDL